jgi:hypothetical protein
MDVLFTQIWEVLHLIIYSSLTNLGFHKTPICVTVTKSSMMTEIDAP